MSEQQQPQTFEETFEDLEYNSETERSFLARHGQVVNGEKVTDERRRHEATQHDFERGIVYERPGDGDGTVTSRLVPNGPLLMNQSEGHL